MSYYEKVLDDVNDLLGNDIKGLLDAPEVESPLIFDIKSEQGGSSLLVSSELEKNDKTNKW